MSLSSFRDQVDRTLGLLVGTIMGAMVVNVLWQVFTRFILRDPSSFTDELARYMLIWLGLFGAAYAAGRSMHLSLDLLMVTSGPKMQAFLNLLIRVCTGVFAGAVMVVGGVRLVYITYILDQTSASLQLPLAWVYLALPVSGLLILFYSVVGPKVEPSQAINDGGLD